MKAKPIRQTYESRDRPVGGGQTIALLAALGLVAAVTAPLRAVVIDDMSGPKRYLDQNGMPNNLDVALRDGQLVLRGQFTTAYPWAADGVGWRDALPDVDLDGRTLELRIDVRSVRENDAFLWWRLLGESGPYYDLWLDQDEIFVLKGGQDQAMFFIEETPTTNQNVTVVFSLTGRGDTLTITSRILDREKGDAVLYEKTVVDGPDKDVDTPLSPRWPGVNYVPDWGPPTTRGFTRVLLGACQFAGETPPPVELVLDNLEYDLRVTAPPQVQSPNVAPSSVSVGARATLSVVASGTSPLTYQWRLNGKDIAGATTRTLVLKNVQLSDEGHYTVVVTNPDGQTTSVPVELDVDPTFTKIAEGSIVNDVAIGSGAAWADYDNDGFLDLFVANGGGNTEQANSLYRNNRDGRFTRITEGPLVTEVALSAVAAWGDYDNDGFTDLFVSGFGAGESFVYRNKSNVTFEKMTRDTIGIALGTCFGSWADYDQDGFLDLFAGGLDGQASRLYRNNGNGTFSEMTNNSLATTLGSPYSCPWADYDSDGRGDLFVANFEGANFLFRNLGGGDFARIQDGPIVNESDDHSIGAAWGDYDNDGFLDLFVANGGWLSSFQSYLYHNRGDGTFTRITDGSLVTDSRPWVAGAWEDYDNDGDLDLFVSSFGPNNALYRSNGNGTFDPVTTGSLVNDVVPTGAYGSCGAAWGDYNKDGFPDLFVANWDRKNYLYRNNSNGNHWVTVQGVGRVSNRSAIGARVRVQATIQGKTYWQMREISCGNGWSGNSLDAHFGLGDATKATTLRIEWPSGIVQELHDVPVDHYLTIEEQRPGPSLAQPRVTTAGEFEFTLLSDVGKPCCIEVSPDLVKWTSLHDLTPTQPAQVVNGGPVGSNRTQFYRVTAKPSTN